jgi:hypothetical protein
LADCLVGWLVGWLIDKLPYTLYTLTKPVTPEGCQDMWPKQLGVLYNK